MRQVATEAWFRPKNFGYGSTPSNWKGWAVTVAFPLLVVALVLAAQHGAISALWCAAVVLAATAIFVALVKAKTSGEWRWRWGRDHG